MTELRRKAIIHVGTLTLEWAQRYCGDVMMGFLVRIRHARPANTHDSLKQTSRLWPKGQNVTPDPAAMLMLRLLRPNGQSCECELMPLIPAAWLRTGLRAGVFRPVGCDAINAHASLSRNRCMAAQALLISSWIGTSTRQSRSFPGVEFMAG